jgi:dTDP-glucose 4,6-dehydratase
MKLLVTGGAGFIGSNFISYSLKRHPRWEITNLDKLTYAGNLENLKDLENEPQYSFIKGDIADWGFVDKLVSQGFDAIINFAAETHVDRSILDAFPFLETNVKGTQILLEGVKKYQVSRFIQVSTDEVYGSIGTGKYCEDALLSPTSPYAASKACADLMCLAYWKTYNTPALITRCTNNFGPYQFPEKLIPLVITNALENEPIPVYGDGLNKRDWIFVGDHCRALDKVVEKGNPGEVYNIAGGNERTNLEIISGILKRLKKPTSLIQFISDRAGHDRRYALDSSFINKKLGWKPDHSFEIALSETVDWYVNNKYWWSRIKDKEYAKYYESVYLGR